MILKMKNVFQFDSSSPSQSQGMAWLAFLVLWNDVPAFCHLIDRMHVCIFFECWRFWLQTGLQGRCYFYSIAMKSEVYQIITFMLDALDPAWPLFMQNICFLRHGMRSPEQAEALDNAGMTYIDAHIKISRMSFQKLSSIGRQVLVECQTEK